MKYSENVIIPFVLFFLLGIVVAWLIFSPAQPYQPRDDSDGPTENSHMNVFTDHRTGCQYLYRGSLTPRMDSNGKQICRP